jgi:small-conductance mechanosensitive channel
MPVDQVGSWISHVLHTTLVTINQTPITPASLIIFSLIVLASIFVTRAFTRLILDRILKRLHIKDGIRYTLRRLTEYTFVLVGTIIAFQFVGVDLSGLAVIFGLLSVGIGFGLQNVTSNFVAGLVPNSQFVSSNIVNWSYGDLRIRLDIDVGVSYGSDLDVVLASLKEVALENPKVLKEPEPDVLFRDFGESSWNMRLRLWIDNPQGHHRIRSDINCAIVRKFREKGVEIPFPQRDLHVRSPLPPPLAKEG